MSQQTDPATGCGGIRNLTAIVCPDCGVGPGGTHTCAPAPAGETEPDLHRPLSGDEHKDFMNYQEAWLRGFNTAREGHPEDVTILTTIRRDWENRGSRREVSWLKLTGGRGL